MKEYEIVNDDQDWRRFIRSRIPFPYELLNNHDDDISRLRLVADVKTKQLFLTPDAEYLWLKIENNSVIDADWPSHSKYNYYSDNYYYRLPDEYKTRISAILEKGIGNDAGTVLNSAFGEKMIPLTGLSVDKIGDNEVHTFKLQPPWPERSAVLSVEIDPKVYLVSYKLIEGKQAREFFEDYRSRKKL
jgi:hypothetical protein